MSEINDRSREEISIAELVEEIEEWLGLRFAIAEDLARLNGDLRAAANFSRAAGAIAPAMTFVAEYLEEAESTGNLNRAQMKGRSIDTSKHRRLDWQWGPAFRGPPLSYSLPRLSR